MYTEKVKKRIEGCIIQSTLRKIGERYVNRKERKKKISKNNQMCRQVKERTEKERRKNEGK